MKISSLSQLLEGNLSPADFRAEITAELNRHLAGLRSAARVGPVEADEDYDLIFDRRKLGVLCKLFASGHISAAELAYTADFVLMADRVDIADPGVETDIAHCAAPEINGPMTVEDALAIAAHDSAP